MPQCSLEISFAFEKRRQANVGLEVARLTSHQIAVNRESLERIFFRQPARLLEALASARRAEALLDLALGALLEIEDQLPRFHLEAVGAVAHHDVPVEVFQLERMDRARRSDETPHALEASLDRFQMTAGGKHLLGEPHQDQIVEREAKVATSKSRGIDELPLDPVANALGRHRENPRRRPSREGLICARRLCHTTQRRRV